MSGTPYADAAHDYQRRGWSPLPLPAQRKSPPPTGWTGYAAACASGADVQAWLDAGQGACNVGLRTPEIVLGIDVDAYGGKPGLKTMLEAIERLGPLPQTVRSTSRADDQVSGIRFYRVPPRRRWADKWPGVEFVHHGHRYAVAWPSIHPEGREYAWYDPAGQLLAELPAVDDLPDLPAPWVAELDVTDRITQDLAYSGPGFLGLPARERDAVLRWTTVTVERIQDQLRASASWPEGQEEIVTGDDGRPRSRGWERLQADLAWRLARLARASWCPLGISEARAAFVSAAPTSATWTRGDVENKWESQQDRGTPAEFPAGIRAQADFLATLSAPTVLTDPGDPATATSSTIEDAEEAAMSQAAAFAREVTREAYKLRIREQAREKVAADKAGALTLPVLTRLGDFLAIPDELVTHRIAGLWPTGGRVVLSAQHKGGKTTLAGNLLRSLADGAAFLDAFDVQPAGRVLLLDNELDEGMLRRWLRDQGISNTEAVDLIPMRGKLSSFNILDPETRGRWAQHLGPANVLVLDCLRPALDALALSEDKDAGRFLEALDELTHEAGIAETLVVHHMGHTGERSRGDSRILDWPDAVWKLIKDAEDEAATQPRRYFAAYGRDVDHPETLLGYDPSSRRLSVAGGSRQDGKAEELIAEIVAYVKAQPRCSQNAIERGLGGKAAVVRRALRLSIERGFVDREKEGQRYLHTYRVPCVPTASGRSDVNRVPASIDADADTAQKQSPTEWDADAVGGPTEALPPALALLGPVTILHTELTEEAADARR